MTCRHPSRNVHNFTWMCVFVIACALRWGVALIGEFILKVHRGMKYIQDLSCEEKARFGFVVYFVNFG